MGVSHATSGLVAGLGAGILLHYSLTADGALAGFTAGMALLPDLDCRSSCASRCLGFASGAVSLVTAKVTGGHRHASHSLLGIAVFTGLAYAACHFRHDLGGKIGLGLLLVIVVAGALEALHLARSHVADVIGAAVTALVIWHGYGLALIPLATLLGTAVHCCGDSLTESGVMWLYPVSQRRIHFLPGRAAFTTGTRPETWLVDPLLVLMFVILGLYAANLWPYLRV